MDADRIGLGEGGRRVTGLDDASGTVVVVVVVPLVTGVLVPVRGHAARVGGFGVCRTSFLSVSIVDQSVVGILEVLVLTTSTHITSPTAGQCHLLLAPVHGPDGNGGGGRHTGSSSGTGGFRVGDIVHVDFQFSHIQFL